MSASMMTLLGKLPVPIFGTARVAASFGMKKAKSAPLALGWAFPAAVGAGWFIWPAVTDDFKISIGLMDDPEAPPPSAKKGVELDDAAKAAIAVAHKVDASTGEEPRAPTAEELEVEKQYLAGDYSGLEKDWGEFMEKAIKPGEDDDDDDDDEDEDEDEDEEGDDDDDEDDE
mmetsp:Transcript_28026/g.36641  ORF Transcript_28026/g.36641 Transcript_28026/m.36641 type:complete len:172 (-) Transcript_28026:130-645(-)